MGNRAIGDPIKWRQNHWGPHKRNRAIGDPKMGMETLEGSKMGDRVIGDPINWGWSHWGPHKMEAKPSGTP